MNIQTERDAIGVRIKALIHELRLNNNSFSIKIGTTPQGIGFIVSGKTKPRFELIEKIVRAFPNVNQNWLVSGEGPMFINSEADSKEKTKPDRSDKYLMEALNKIERSFTANIEEKDSIIKDQRFIIEALKSQIELMKVNFELGKLDLSEDILPVIPEAKVIDFKPLLTASLTVERMVSLGS